MVLDDRRPVIKAVALSKSFGGRRAVEDVTFAVAAGEVVGFLGPNGAGKTTTIRLLLGLLRPDAGEAHRPPAVGYLPELVSAYDQLSVRGYLRFLCRMKRAAPAEADRAMALLDLAALARRPVGRLSRGQRQRAGLAAALVGRPPAYILDEPTAGLDPRQVVHVRAILRSLASDGAAVLVSTHLLAEAAAVCDRVVVIAGGRVVAEERPGEATDLEARFLRLVGEAELS